MLLSLVAALAVTAAASARPADQAFFGAPPPPPPPLPAPAIPLGNDSHASSFAPLLPPAIPLAVKSPYLNCWLSAGGDDGSKGYLAGSWAQHWPVHYAGSQRDHRLSWAGLIDIDGETFEFLGAPLSDAAPLLGPSKVARQTAFVYTATRSIFTFEARGVEFNATFLSPVSPNDVVRQSLPFSYLIVEVDPSALAKHAISVYTDISGEWASGEASVDLTWTYTSGSGVGTHAISRQKQLRFGEVAEQAEYGRATYATALRKGVVAGSGPADQLRKRFIHHGKLDGSHDVEYRKLDDRQPVFGFSVALSGQDPTAVFTIGHVRDPYVNYVTPDGQVNLSGAWTTRWPHYIDAISAFQSSASRALDEATRFDHTLREDARRVSGDNYAAIVELSTRQAFATFELTTGVDDDWKEDKEAVMAHLKEISSNGDMTTIDVVFPLHPILLYTNPTLLAYLLEPLLRYTHSGLYPNRWPVHDLGTYPNSTGYNRGDDEPMPVEESGNMLWMALAYFQLTGDKAWVEKHYDVFKQWTTFLTDDGLVPAEQLSTDDFAGTLANQTNLAMKAIVGIGAMAELANGIGRWTDWVHYRSVAKAYAAEWTKMAMTDAGGVRHAKLAYQDEDSWGTLYNLFGDRALNLQLFDRNLYKDQAEWYERKFEKYGLPLDSRHAWAKTDWHLFAAGSATTKEGRDSFVDSLVDFLQAGKVDAPFPDLYETPTASFPGREGFDWPIYFIARPVVGGHFALLALEKADGANGVDEDHFRE
ncbi:glutaminase GtaA [Rhodotorula diobovata]|uniref:Glutaminase GtaA n=1 Tax=Rhodotorula diobovata TaxID=5288 RepID=A0A5C5FU85_9BASI|nr:glutaminase GtaA [Rhodotorula diobovata]